MVPHIDDAALLADTRSLLAEPPETVIVTTGIGFRAWIEAADAYGLAEPLVDMLRGTRLVARGPKARGAIQAAGLTADWVAESETSAEIAEVLLDEGVAGRDIAIQHHGAGADGLDDVFATAGARVRSLVVYRWGPPPDAAVVEASVRSVAAGEIDAVVFTSAPGAAAWFEAADDAGVADQIARLARRGSVVMAAVGPITAKPLQERGIEPLLPDRGRLGSLVRALVGHYGGLEALRTIAGPLQVHRGAAVLDGHVLALTPTGARGAPAAGQGGGSVVPRDHVLAVLPGDSTDPHAAEVAIARLRDATGSRALVKTVVKRGYRLELEEV